MKYQHIITLLRQWQLQITTLWQGYNSVDYVHLGYSVTVDTKSLISIHIYLALYFKEIAHCYALCVYETHSYICSIQLDLKVKTLVRGIYNYKLVIDKFNQAQGISQGNAIWSLWMKVTLGLSTVIYVLVFWKKSTRH